MKTLSVGLLLPASSILPMGKEFNTGLKNGLKDLMEDGDWDVKLIPEVVGQGSKKSVSDAITKLFEFYEADIVAGIVSNNVATQMGESLNIAKKPLLISNIGEHLPHLDRLNAYTFLHSSNIWREIWSLSHDAVKQFGKKGMFVAGMYETGYSFMHMMKLGMLAADESCEMPFAVAPLNEDRKTADTSKVFNHIETFKPDFILGFFCGDEASSFLGEYVDRGLHKTTPLLSLPFLLESFDAKGEEIEVFTAISSSEILPAGPLKKELQPITSHFSDLGYESGKIIAEAARRSEGGDMLGVMRTLTMQPQQASGDVSPQSDSATQKGKNVYLISNRYKGNKNEIERSVIRQLPSLEMSDPAFTESLNAISTGWDNPYPGV